MPATPLETSSRHSEAVIWAAELAAGTLDSMNCLNLGSFCSVTAALSQTFARGIYLNKALLALALILLKDEGQDAVDAELAGGPSEPYQDSRVLHRPREHSI
jgi:hypothetical protein